MQTTTFKLLALSSLLFALSITAKSQTWQELDSLSNMHKSKKDYKQALVYSQKAVEVYESEFGKESIDYGKLQYNLGLNLYFLGQFKNALHSLLIVRDIYESALGNDSYEYGQCLSDIGMTYRQLGEYNLALNNYYLALEIMEKALGKEHPSFGALLMNLGVVYKTIGQYDKALDLYTEACACLEISYGKVSQQNAKCLNNIAQLYSTIGQYDKSLPLLLEAMEYTEKVLGKGHPDYANYLNNLAAFYRRLGQFERSLGLYFEAKEIYEKIYGSNHPSFCYLNNNIGLVYKALNEYEKALPVFIETLEKTEAIFGKNHSFYCVVLNNLAFLSMDLGQNEKALSHFNEALEIVEKTLGKNHYEYGRILNNLALLYDKKLDYERALNLYLEAQQNLEKSLGKEHHEYATLMNNTARIYEALSQNDMAYSLYKDAIQNNFININKMFSFLTEAEKENFINTITTFYNYYYSFFTRNANADPKIAAEAYNLILTTKGMILQSGIELRKVIQNSDSKQLLEKYDEWIEVKTKISAQYALPAQDRKEDLVALEKKTELLEGELTRLSNYFKQSKYLTEVRWSDVQKKLKDDEMAIEFVAFKYFSTNHSTDSVLYLALILSKKNPYPILVELFEENQIADLIKTNHTNSFDHINEKYGKKSESTNKSSELYNLIWEPIKPYLNEINTVYISPDGLLHNISFAALSNNKNDFIIDNIYISMVTSTSQINDVFDKLVIRNASLFGGVFFDGPFSQNKVWKYLEGTSVEVDKINKLLKKKKVKTAVFKNHLATEEQFKKNSNNIDILHVATHGFFYPDPKKVAEIEKTTTKVGEVTFRGGESGIGLSSFVKNSNPLMRSGLVFAGANDVWNEVERDDSKQDGILTAYEVANQNLQNTKLVVLSACETGLGDIRGSEGVYGLQRAFKMAGAKYLIMSLWQVPDKETAEFMELFYSKLLNHNDIRKSFSETQREMRQKYDPFFWAAFVLVE
jgi:CHAT domain-containing protein/prefoldin subunit 5